MLEIFYYANWYFKSRFLGKKIPLQSVIFIGSRCNLKCKHCGVAKATEAGLLDGEDFPFEKVISLMKQCYDAGSRMVTFEGGEPLLWKEGDLVLEDLITAAHKMGFVSTSFSTNGTLPIPNGKTDRIFVSLDGTRKYHDMIRGDGCFDLAIKNINESNYPHLSVNFVANVMNWSDLPDFIETVSKIPNIKGISVSFHTPHTGTEDMFLPWDKRHQVVDWLIDFKKKGYPIINSTEGLRRLRDNKYVQRCWVTDFVLPDGKRYPYCPGYEEKICEKCGYGMGAEMSAVWDLVPSTIIVGLKLFSKV
jgi:Fe-coproporphyrin III synthase